MTNAGKYVLTWAAHGVFADCGPEVRRFKSADEMLRWLACDWPHVERQKEPHIWDAMFVSRREIRL